MRMYVSEVDLWQELRTVNPRGYMMRLRFTCKEGAGGVSGENDQAASWPVTFRTPQEGLGCDSCSSSRCLPCPAGLRVTSRKLLARDGCLRSFRGTSPAASNPSTVAPRTRREMG